MVRRRGDPGTRRGGVLLLVLVLVLALELMAHGALLMARQEAAASTAAAALVQATVASEVGARALGASLGVRYDSMPLWGTVDGPDGVVGAGRFHVRLRRLARETWLWSSRGASTRPGSVTTVHSVWLPDPVARLQAMTAVVTVGIGAPVAGAGRIETAGVRWDRPPLDTSPCDVWRPVLDSLFAGGGIPALAQEAMETHGGAALGRLEAEQLVAWIGDGGTMGPRAVPGDLRVVGETSEGLLVVGGDLEMVGGRHEGVVLVGGALTLRDGAQIFGVVRAGSGVAIGPASRVVGSGCRALLALSDGLDGWARPEALGPRPFTLF